MIKKILRGAIALLLTLSLLPLIPVSATASDAAIQALLSAEMKAADADLPQSYIDEELTEQAGILSEWTVLALSQWKSFDFTAYEEALLSYLSQNTYAPPTTQLKYAMCLGAVGSTDSYISLVLRDAVGKQGIMSWVWGLHMVNNGYACAYSATEIANKLLELQGEDGGWSLNGKASDVDVTAMVLQALATDTEIRALSQAAIEQALSFLSQAQKEDGSFSSYGTCNPESGAQVLIALYTLGMDPNSDTRFIHNGNTIWDGIRQFQTEDGRYSHTLGGVYNSNATSQVMLAMVAEYRFQSGLTPLYLLDHATPDDVLPIPEETQETISETLDNVTEQETDAEYNPSEETSRIKLWLSLALIVLGILVCAVLLLKKSNAKNLIAVGLTVAVLLGVLQLLDIQTPQEHYENTEMDTHNVIGEVTISIRCDTIVDKSSDTSLPADGVLLPAVSIPIEKGDTVYDVLMRASAAHRFTVENNGNEKMAYIVGIDNLYAFDHGDLSGWVYRVNGESPSIGCSEYELQPDDTVVWHYTLEAGADIP